MMEQTAARLDNQGIAALLVLKNKSLTLTSGIPFASFFYVQDVRYTGIAGAKSR